MSSEAIESVWRAEAPHVLTALLRRNIDFDACEDALQDAIVAASQQWEAQGVPDRPRAWLVRVASRRLIDQHRSRTARHDREQRVARDPTATPPVAAAADVELDVFKPAAEDETLHLLLLCAHPALTPASQVALTLRAVAGLTTAQIAAAFMVPEATMAQRIVRAKAAIVEAGSHVPSPRIADLPARVHAARQVLYLAFNEGYTASTGDVLVDVDVAAEAIRLTEILHRALPSDTETTGLLSLMLLTHARAGGRTDGAGEIIPLPRQNRSRWDGYLISRGARLIELALPRGRVGPFQLQAAIAAVHSEAPTSAATDWHQIVELYRMLHKLAPSAVVSLNLAVAIGMDEGAEAGLDALGPLLAQPDQQRNHRVHSAHAHLLELTGNTAGAVVAFRRAASLTNSIPEQRYLNRRAASPSAGQLS